MMYKRFCLLLVVWSVSCLAMAQSSAHQQYIDKYKHLAVAQMKKYGIPASITLAQGLLESDAGRSMLAVEGNNHFGIKCHSDWSGKRMYHDDDRRDDCFRVYRNVEGSFEDHSLFLTTHLCKFVDVCIANEEDASDVFGIRSEGTDVTGGKVNHEGYKEVAAKLQERFGFKASFQAGNKA